MQELAPTPTRVDLVLQYLQEWPTPFGENDLKTTENTPFTSGRTSAIQNRSLGVRKLKLKLKLFILRYPMLMLLA